ncbi:MAG: hypothetical protein AMXMBFR64_15950 [Myxococcales bacterium]
MSNEPDAVRPRVDLYRQITGRIIEALERGVAPWVCPWQRSREKGPQRNGVSGRQYQGINTLLTMIAGFASTRWYTARQVGKLGGRLLEGERATTLVWFEMRYIETSEGPDGVGTVGRVVPVLREHEVFNAEQIAWPEGSKHALPVAPERRGQWEDELPRQLVERSGARVERRGTRAYYSPSEDRIVLPVEERFEDPTSYYGTLLHELAHWTGHRDRLDRDFSKRFGDERYAFEELVAELTAAFLCAHVGLDGTLQHAGYIDSWLNVLRRDKRAIFTASAQAQKAAELLLWKGGLGPEPRRPKGPWTPPDAEAGEAEPSQRRRRHPRETGSQTFVDS